MRTSVFNTAEQRELVQRLTMHGFDVYFTLTLTADKAMPERLRQLTQTFIGRVRANHGFPHHWYAICWEATEDGSTQYHVHGFLRDVKNLGSPDELADYWSEEYVVKPKRGKPYKRTRPLGKSLFEAVWYPRGVSDYVAPQIVFGPFTNVPPLRGYEVKQAVSLAQELSHAS